MIVKRGSLMFTVNDYCKEQFGSKVYKISLSGGMTCPNRDGKCGTRGCIFCSSGGSGEFSADKLLSITDQLKKAKELVSKKYKGDKFIAYFGSFTNTYADVSYLEKIFSEAINDPQVVVLSIATRPDCLDTDVIKLIEQLNKIKPVWVELGLQTSKSETVEYIRRGYDNKIYIDAVDKLKRVGVHVITHIILGLPYETKEDMLSTVEFAINTGTNGIKLQLLHVLENTDLYDDFVAGKFKVLDREEYIDLVVSCLKIIPKDIVIHRLTGDGPKRILVAPKWSADKKTVLNALNKAIKLANL